MPRTDLIFGKQLPILLVLLAAGSLTAMTGSLVSPVFPEVVEALRIDPQWAGILVGMHTLTIALFSPIFGLLSDRLGKVRVLVPCLLGYAAFGMAGAWAQNFESMLAARALLGAVSGGVAAASVGIVGSMFEGAARSRMMGYTTSALATTSIFFPLLGGWLGSFQWQYSFYLYALGIPVAIAAMLVLREQKSQSIQISKSQRQALVENLQQSNVQMLLLALVLASGLFYVVIVYAPLYFKTAIGATPAVNGMILASRAVGAAIISAVGASRLALRYGISAAIGLGFFTMAVMLLTIPFLQPVSLILLAAVLFGMGYGIVMPNLYDALARLSSPEARASVLAFGTGVSSLGQFMSPVVLGPVWKHGSIMVFYLGAAVGLLIALLSFWRSRSLSRKPNLK